VGKTLPTSKYKGDGYSVNGDVEFIANYLKESGTKLADKKKQDAIMLTATVEW